MVGAGPGDPALLTVGGHEAIAHAQVLAHDSLVSADIVALAPPDAERIPVTRKGDPGAVPQTEIAALLAQKAKAGLRVVRLKGGDPFVYGRGYEELAALKALGVPVKVIPGLTAALAAPALAGIPVTCGDLSGAVHIVSGSPRTGQALTLDYDALVRVGGTLVLLMATQRLGEISGGLLAAGMPADTAAALIENGGLPGQRRVDATLGTLADMAAEYAIKEPAVALVGPVCALLNCQ